MMREFRLGVGKAAIIIATEMKRRVPRKRDSSILERSTMTIVLPYLERKSPRVSRRHRAKTHPAGIEELVDPYQARIHC